MGDTLKGRVAIVTGSGHGIGRAIAMALAAEGAKVVTNNRRPGGRVTANISREALDKLDAAAKKKLDEDTEKYSGDAETTAQAILSAGGEATACFADISRFDEAKKLVETAVGTYGKIDIVVNVAGILAQDSVEDITEEKWDECLNAKPKGYFNVVHFAAPYMIAQGYGRIVNCASGAFMGDRFFDDAHYCAANAGVVGLTRAIAGELYSRGITANAFCPHAHTRPSVPDLDEVRFAGRPKFPPAPDPSTLCPFIVFLCSEKSGHISGTVFSLNGNTISRHREPSVIRTMIKPVDRGIWTVEEIDRWVDSKLLNGYHSICEQLQ
jgi:3-oxoacyl-[acyl-carrier protein] reductase